MMSDKVSIEVQVLDNATREYKRIESSIVGGSKNADKAIEEMGDEAKRAEREIRGLEKSSGVLAGSTKKLVAAIGGMFALSKVNSLIKESISLYGIQAEAEAKVTATIKATGGAAGVTTDELKAMASGLQGVTTWGDETILRGQSMLLTFKQIGKDIFPQATEAMLNLATAMQTDVQSASIQLGKALNDPIEGVAALRRVGIQLSDSQEKTIKSMMDMNNISGAQAVILGELESQFGGLARAVAETESGKLKQFQNIMGDIKEQIGAALIPALIDVQSAFANVMSEAERTGGLSEGMQDMAKVARITAAAVIDIGSSFRFLFYTGQSVIIGVSSLLTNFGALALKIVSETAQLINKLPGTLIPDRWIESINKAHDTLAETGVAGMEEAANTFMKGVANGSALIDVFTDLENTAAKLKKTAGSGVVSVTGTDSIGGVGSESDKDQAARKAAIQQFQNEMLVLNKTGLDRELTQLEMAREQKRSILAINAQDAAEFYELEKQLDINFDLFKQSLIDKDTERRNQEQEKRKQELEQIKANLKANTDAIAQAEAQKTDAVKREAEVRRQIMLDDMNRGVDATNNLIAAMGNLYSKSKKNAGLHKALAISETVINSARAFMQALTTPPGPPFTIPLAGSIAALGASKVAMISSQKFAQGGIVEGQKSGDKVPIWANGGEMVLNKRQQQNLLNGGAGSRFSFGDTVINVTGNANPNDIAKAVNSTIQERMDAAARMNRKMAVHGL